MKFEMAKSDDPREIAIAAQRSLIDAILYVVSEVRAENDPRIPGMTWEQIEYLLQRFRDKEPKIIVQKQEM